MSVSQFTLGILSANLHYRKDQISKAVLYIFYQISVLPEEFLMKLSSLNKEIKMTEASCFLMKKVVKVGWLHMIQNFPIFPHHRMEF